MRRLYVRTELDTVTRDLALLRTAIETQAIMNSALIQCVVDEWADAKFVKDFERADRLREVLHSVGIEPLMGTKYYDGTLHNVGGDHYVYADLPKHVVGNQVDNTWRYRT